MLNKKKVSFDILVIVLACICFTVITMMDIRLWEDKDMSNVNLFSQTRFETKNFIIDLSNSNWIGQDGRVVAVFVGAAINTKNVEGEVRPMVLLFHDFSNDYIDYLKNACDKLFEKSVQKIDDWEAEVYSCITSDREDFTDKHIAYKGEALLIGYYIDDMEVYQPQYDEFFKSIKLK